MKVRRVTAIALSVLLLFFMLGGQAVPAGAEGQAGTTLTAEVDCTPHWTITYHWTIDKSVTPATWNLFTGNSGTSQYTITVTKDSGTQEAWVGGQVCVTNGGAVATENLAITAVLQDGYGPPNDFLTSAPVDVSSHPVLAPGETFCYAYHVNIPITGGDFPQPHAGGTYKVTADVTITNHSGSLGEASGPSPSCTCVFPASPTEINGTIHVDDSNGGSWEFSGSGSVSYMKTFTCDGDEGKLDNTATIVETGQSDSASVTVNCYALNVRKDANTSLTRTYQWAIRKSASHISLTLAAGEQFLVTYSVVVGLDTTNYPPNGWVDSDWSVNGTIRVSNPAPMAATINGISDAVAPDIAATVDCGVTFPYQLAAGTYMDCTYSADLPNGRGRTNTATATLQNYDYGEDGVGTPSGTTDFSRTVAFDFSAPTITEVDECADVTDTYAGALGTVCYPNVPHTFTYSRWIGPYEQCGNYIVSNTATVTAGDSSASSSSTVNISVSVPCDGCTLTPGYWKTHSSYGPAPYDDTWALRGENTIFFLSGQTYYQVLWTNPSGGNAYYILAHAYIAAELNFLNGADPSAAQAAFNSATALFNTYTPAEVAEAKGKTGKDLRDQFIYLAGILDAYNNGYIGPGHCSE